MGVHSTETPRIVEPHQSSSDNTILEDSQRVWLPVGTHQSAYAVAVDDPTKVFGVEAGSSWSRSVVVVYQEWQAVQRRGSHQGRRPCS